MGKITEISFDDTTRNVPAICFFFEEQQPHCLVDELDVPLEFSYEVFICQATGSDIPNWIEVVNPEGLKNAEDEWILPDIKGVSFEDEELGISLEDTTFENIAKKVIEKMY